MNRMMMKKKKKKLKTSSPQKPMKVVYISNPVRFKATTSEFRALVQELTGQDSDQTHPLQQFNEDKEDGVSSIAACRNQELLQYHHPNNKQVSVQATSMEDTDNRVGDHQLEMFDDDVFTRLSELLPSGFLVI